jgi:hypothetical protein
MLLTELENVRSSRFNTDQKGSKGGPSDYANFVEGLASEVERCTAQFSEDPRARRLQEKL